MVKTPHLFLEMVKKFISIYNVPILMFCPLRWILFPMYQIRLIIYWKNKNKNKKNPQTYAFSSQSVTVLIIAMNMLIFSKLTEWDAGLYFECSEHSKLLTPSNTVLCMLFWKQACYVQHARMSAWLF